MRIAPDWAAPWFEPYRDVAAPVLARLADGAPVLEALGHARFEPAGPLRLGYEWHIAATGRVPAALPPLPVLGIPGWWPANEGRASTLTTGYSAQSS
ncbi:DUF3025 domain-containing protein [Roseateles saccharophilus]|uniref:Uncharacterized protein n=1 Tax=Roseateles saccharophilus TaxID=304 RepID=A0A4R3VDY8_ROSSA|nr:DUF3025 domain-containing protein [Roseateles saccharophilus]TCV02133.1 hypothetical protein EV671_1005169 [Roseateles saccharophilus]